MTELEAGRILAEHRAECPSFVRGRGLYKVRRDGRVDVYRGNPKTDRWIFDQTVEAGWITLPEDVRRRSLEARS